MCKLVQSLTCVLHRTRQRVIHRSCPSLACSSGNHTIAGLGRTGTCFTCGDKGHGRGMMSAKRSVDLPPAPRVHCPHLLIWKQVSRAPRKAKGNVLRSWLGHRGICPPLTSRGVGRDLDFESTTAVNDLKVLPRGGPPVANTICSLAAYKASQSSSRVASLRGGIISPVLRLRAAGPPAPGASWHQNLIFQIHSWLPLPCRLPRLEEEKLVPR